MQVAVLAGDILPEQVGLHWVAQDQDGAASVRPIEVHADATLSNWEPGTFEQEQELAHEILDRRWKRMQEEP